MLKSMLPKLHHGYPCPAWIFKSILTWIFMIKIHASMDIHDQNLCQHGYPLSKSMPAWISMLESMLPKLHHGYLCSAWIFKSILTWISMIKIHASMDSNMDIHVSSTDIHASCKDIRANEAWILGPGKW